MLENMHAEEAAQYGCMTVFFLHIFFSQKKGSLPFFNLLLSFLKNKRPGLKPKLAFHRKNMKL